MPVLCLVLESLFIPAYGQDVDKASIRSEKKLLKRSRFIPGLFNEWKHTGIVMIDSLECNTQIQTINYYLSSSATNIPIRDEWLANLKATIKSNLGKRFKDYAINLYARGRSLEEYVPNFYRQSQLFYDRSRLSSLFEVTPLVTDLNRTYYSEGLSGKHIALWPSHGFFFDQQAERWQWQRARLFGTVEDIFPWLFTRDFLVPMLESSGATVLLPRERDTQSCETIVDNESRKDSSELVIINGINNWEDSYLKGFSFCDTLYEGDNPFKKGSFLKINSNPKDTARLVYVPDIPETGDYAVYVSWGVAEKCTDSVYYEVNYNGGTARYSINQCMGAATWIYLGTFHFNRGRYMEQGSVVVYGKGDGGTITSDAVRFGGGMGNVARRTNDSAIWHTSGKPRWMEGARYYLQFSGMPDSIVYNLTYGTNDYNDDYLSRGEWVNFMVGKSKPQYTAKYNNGLNIPVDLSLAFHTDAGTSRGDTIIGTLSIYSAQRNNGVFPNGQSKLASRDLADLIQTQVVEDIRQLANPAWTRRGLWDREYSEAWRPAVPTMMLELLSHQNLADMKYGLDPRFRFIVARAIYKGIIRYLSVQTGKNPVVQPLPPDHMAIEIIEGRNIKISWDDIVDPIEPTAAPTGYKVSMRLENEGFAPGVFTNDTFMAITLPEWGKIYSFRVTALNSGGESLPGETLSVAVFNNNKKPVLIVNAFDRICGPAVFDKDDMAGIAWWEDEGVTFGDDYSHTGNQYDFSRESEWLHDDSQGWGASNADMETYPVSGNSFSFPLIHGKALRDAGYSFTSVSDEVFETPGYNTAVFSAVDVVFGEERGTEMLKDSSRKEFRIFTPAIMNAISRYVQKNGNIFISGAYIGTDMVENHDSLAMRFASDVLHYTWRTNHATVKGLTYATDKAMASFPEHLQFNTGFYPGIYKVESPDAIEPSGDGAFRIYRYTSGNCSAGVAYEGTYHSIVLGFPFETIIPDEQRVELMKDIMKFFRDDFTTVPSSRLNGTGSKGVVSEK